MNRTALRAGPLSHAEVLDFRVLVATAAAKLTAGEEGPDFNDRLIYKGRNLLQLLFGKPAGLALYPHS